MAGRKLFQGTQLAFDLGWWRLMKPHCTRDTQAGNTVNHMENTENSSRVFISDRSDCFSGCISTNRFLYKTSKAFSEWLVEATTAFIIVVPRLNLHQFTKNTLQCIII